MGEFFNKRNPFMDYRNIVPFIDLSEFIMRQPCAIDERPAVSLKEKLFKKKFSSAVNFRRMEYKIKCEEYKNGLR